MPSRIPAKIGVSYSWTGRCAASLDLLPHLGTYDGSISAAGYCFAGLPMGSHFDVSLAQRILKPGSTCLVCSTARISRSKALLSRNNWFVPWMMRYYDRKEGKRQAA